MMSLTPVPNDGSGSRSILGETLLCCGGSAGSTKSRAVRKSKSGLAGRGWASNIGSDTAM